MSEVLDGTAEALEAGEPAASASPPSPGRFAERALRWGRAHILALVGVPVGAITLFLLYLHQARTVALNSDGSSNALQAWDMLHGNLLLSHWTLSDVSFYLTELPEYMLVEAVHGLNSDVVHIAGAFTYTLAVLLACWLARGRARGPEAFVRILIVLAIMLAPPLGVDTLVVLSSPDHFGTAVPLLVFLLAAQRLPRRWFTPVILFVLMAWAGVSDSTAAFIAGGALAVVAGIRLWQGHGDRRYQCALLAAAALSIAVSFEFAKFVYQQGGYKLHPPNMAFNGADAMATASWTTVKSFLDLFGADFFGLPVTVANRTGAGSTVQHQTIVVLLHLFGVALAVWGLALAARRLPREDDWIAELITVGVLLNVLALMFSSQIAGGSREIAAALPLGAVVAARMLGPLMVHRKHIVVLSAFTMAMFAVLVHNAGSPGRPANGHAAQAWLKKHGYTYGLGGYWSSNSITVDSGDTVRVRPVHTLLRGIEQYDWESDSAWYDPAKNYANFLVMDVDPPSFAAYATPEQAVKQFGKPDLTAVVGSQEIMVWHKNLLATLPPPSPPPSLPASN